MNGARIDQELSSLWKGLKIQCHETVTSTNDWAKESIKKNPETEFLIVSEKQTKGRGRRGRNFYSSIDQGLYFTLAIHPKDRKDEELPLYTIAAATALLQAVEKELGLELQVKWVNDVFYKGRKVAGILSEAITDSATNQITSLLIGVGLNIAGSFDAADRTTKEVAGTLYQQIPADFDKSSLLQEFLLQFWDYHQNLKKKNFLAVYEEHLLGTGCAVHYERKNKQYSGKIQGINEQGQLLVKNEEGKIFSLLGGEIHFSSDQFIKNIGEANESL